MRAPSGSSKSLGLLVKEGEDQPGFLALQTLDYLVRNGVVPEANDWDTGSLDQPLSQELGSTCCDLVLLQALQWTMAGEEGNRGKHESGGRGGGVPSSCPTPGRQSHLPPLLLAFIRGL